MFFIFCRDLTDLISRSKLIYNSELQSVLPLIILMGMFLVLIVVCGALWLVAVGVFVFCLLLCLVGSVWNEDHLDREKGVIALLLR